MTKITCVCLSCLFLMCACFLGGCQKEAEDSSAWQRGLSIELYDFGSDRSQYAEEDDLQGALQDLYRVCYYKPEVLASTVSAFSSIKAAADFDAEATAQEIDHYLSFGEHGGSVQEQLLEELRKALESPQTSSRFIERNDKVEMLHMYKSDPEQPDTPANIKLLSVPTDLNGETYACLEITIKGDTGIFYLPGGFQRIDP